MADKEGLERYINRDADFASVDTVLFHTIKTLACDGCGKQIEIPRDMFAQKYICDGCNGIKR